MVYEKVYEDNATGKVTDEWFMQLSHKYEVERGELKMKIADLRKRLQEADTKQAGRDNFIAAIRRFMEMKRLTRPLLHELIDRIEVHETEGRWNLGRLTDLATGTGGLECYFVNNIIDDSADARANSLIVGVHTNSGLVVSASGTGITLSHEIGHAFGMRDVYAATSDGADLLDATCWDWQPYDWNGGCFGSGGGRARYYKGDASQCSVIRLMLMDGEKAKLSKGIDITYGDVWGFDIQDVQGHRDTGFFTNVRQTENPQHN